MTGVVIKNLKESVNQTAETIYQGFRWKTVTHSPNVFNVFWLHLSLLHKTNLMNQESTASQLSHLDIKKID